MGCFIDFLCNPQNHSLNLNFLIALMTEPIWSCWSFWVTFLLWCRSLMQHWRGTVDGIFMWRTLYWTTCLLGCFRGTKLQHINHYSFKSESGGIHARNEYCTLCTLHDLMRLHTESTQSSMNLFYSWKEPVCVSVRMFLTATLLTYQHTILSFIWSFLAEDLLNKTLKGSEVKQAEPMLSLPSLSFYPTYSI